VPVRPCFFGARLVLSDAEGLALLALRYEGSNAEGLVLACPEVRREQCRRASNRRLRLTTRLPRLRMPLPFHPFALGCAGLPPVGKDSSSPKDLPQEGRSPGKVALRRASRSLGGRGFSPGVNSRREAPTYRGAFSASLTPLGPAPSTHLARLRFCPLLRSLPNVKCGNSPILKAWPTGPNACAGLVIVGTFGTTIGTMAQIGVVTTPLG
jgi:hypothetical protein